MKNAFIRQYKRLFYLFCAHRIGIRWLRGYWSGVWVFWFRPCRKDSGDMGRIKLVLTAEVLVPILKKNQFITHYKHSKKDFFFFWKLKIQWEIKENELRFYFYERYTWPGLCMVFMPEVWDTNCRGFAYGESVLAEFSCIFFIWSASWRSVRPISRRPAV